MSGEGSLSLEEARRLSGESREELLRNIEKTAHDNEAIYWGCCQAVINSLQKHLKIGNAETFRVGSGFSGGIGDSLEACGGLTGGVIAISSVYGRDHYEEGKIASSTPSSVETKIRCQLLTERFREKYGSLRCADIRALVRGLEPTQESMQHETPEELVEYMKDHDRACGTVTGTGARLAAEILLETTETFAAQIDAKVAMFSAARKLCMERP